MRIQRFLATALALALVLGCQAWMPATGSATVILFDDFDSENGGSHQLNYDGFGNWKVSGGTVDPGAYLLEFDLAGNRRTDRAESVLVQAGRGNPASQNDSLGRGAPFQTDSLALTVDSPTIAELTFEGVGGDDMGMLLDKVKLTKTSTPVPEPAGLFLVGAGLLGLAGLGRRKRPA